MISFFNPHALIALVLIPLAYFLYGRAKPESIRVPSILIWKRAAKNTLGANEVERKVDIKLLLYLAAIFTGILAISRPVIVHSAAAPAVYREDSAAPSSESFLAITNAFVSQSEELYVWVSSTKSRNVSDDADNAVLETDLGAGSVRRTVTVGPERTARVNMGTLSGSPDTIKISLSEIDGLSLDSTTLSKSEGPHVIHIFGRRDRYLEKALLAIPRAEVKNAWGRSPDAGPAVFVETSIDFLPPGDVAVINPGGKIGPVTIEGKKSVDRLTVEDPDEALLEGVNVKRMGVREVLTGSFPEETKTIVSAGGMPVIATMPNRGGRLLYVGFDMLGGDFHDYPSFPIFWYNFFGGGVTSYSVDQLPGNTIRPAAQPAAVAEEKDLSPLFLILMLAAIAGIWSVGFKT